jgi:hypothetical protein
MRRVVDGATGFGDGVIALLHTWPKATSEAVVSIVNDLTNSGWRFVRLDELTERTLKSSPA